MDYHSIYGNKEKIPPLRRIFDMKSTTCMSLREKSSTVYDLSSLNFTSLSGARATMPATLQQQKRSKSAISEPNPWTDGHL